MNKLRVPVVAGQFYSSSPSELKKQIESFIGKGVTKTSAIACMLPHAGYIYSGQVAAETISQVMVKDTVLLLGPNHTGYGSAFSIMTEGSWQTPLGETKINSGLARKILGCSTYLKEDSLAHQHEHSLEVELPLLQFFNPACQIVPVALLSDDLEALKLTGNEIAKAITDSGYKDNLLIVASSDMTHYETKSQAEKKDTLAISAILQLNESLLMQTIAQYDISMCGYAPVIIMLSAAKALGAISAKLIKYQTSGEVTHDEESVVGYAGIAIY